LVLLAARAERTVGPEHDERRVTLAAHRPVVGAESVILLGTDLDSIVLAPLGTERADLLADLHVALALVPVRLVDGGPNADMDAHLFLAPQVAQVAAGRDVHLADGDVVVARLLQALEPVEPLRHRGLALPRRILGADVIERLLP